MDMQDAARAVVALVQAIAEGKEIETRSALVPNASWATYTMRNSMIVFNLEHYEYRIKRDLREELFDLVKKYGTKMYHAGMAQENKHTEAEESFRKKAKEDGEKIELLVDMMLRGEK